MRLDSTGSNDRTLKVQRPALLGEWSGNVNVLGGERTARPPSEKKGHGHPLGVGIVNPRVPRPLRNYLTPKVTSAGIDSRIRGRVSVLLSKARR